MIRETWLSGSFERRVHHKSQKRRPSLSHSAGANSIGDTIMLPVQRESDNNEKLLATALDYARRGWSIIPTTGKRAACRWKTTQERPANAEKLRRMFARPGVTGLAVVLGTASRGLACRDFDDADAYYRWAKAHPQLAAALPTVETPRGFHVYFAGPEGFHNLDDGEYRADAKHYCLLPPSLHPNGKLYEWLIQLPDGDLPALNPVDAGLLPLSTRESKTQENTQAHTPHTPHSLHVSTGCVKAAIIATLPTKPGQRNRRLFDFARQLKAIMPSAAIDELETIVRAWHTRALSVIRTKDWLESWLDFRIAWAKVKMSAGGTMTGILAKAKAQTPADANAIGKVVVLCRVLQDHHGPGRVWPLACRIAKIASGTSHQTAAKILKILCIDGIIELVTQGGPKRSRLAAEYRLVGV